MLLQVFSEKIFNLIKIYKSLKVKKIFLFILLCIVLSKNDLFAQIGGTSVYRFLDLTSSAKVGSLGGNNISLTTNDLNLPHYNPALLKKDMNNNLALNYVSYFADIKWGYAAYSKYFENLGTFAAGIKYINYGDFIEADQNGNKLGEFTASEYAFDIIWSKPIDSLWTFGVNMKPIYSVLERYTSFGLAFDFGVNYFKQSKLFSFSIVAKNIGTQIKPYYKEHYEKIPFDIQMGITKKLEHAPFRISITAQHLQKPNLNYEVSEEDELVLDEFSSPKTESWYVKYPDMALRHVVFGIEFIPMKSFNVNIGYNHQRKQEMKLDTKSGFAGISWGISIYLKQFQFEYGRATYHLAGASNLISIKVNFDKLLKKTSL